MKPASRITCVRTLRVPERANILWVEIETAEGLTGLGESFRGAAAVEGQVHELVAPYLLGQDSRNIERIHRHLMTPYVGFGASSAEMRAASAVDIALWDLMGQRLGVPVHEALGGLSRDRIRAYNTCAGYDYNSRGTAATSAPGRMRPAPMTTRSPSCSAPTNWRIRCWRKASPP